MSQAFSAAHRRCILLPHEPHSASESLPPQLRICIACQSSSPKATHRQTRPAATSQLRSPRKRAPRPWLSRCLRPAPSTPRRETSELVVLLKQCPQRPYIKSAGSLQSGEDATHTASLAQSCGRIGEYIVNELQPGVVHREAISRRRTRRDGRAIWLYQTYYPSLLGGEYQCFRSAADRGSLGASWTLWGTLGARFRLSGGRYVFMHLAPSLLPSTAPAVTRI